VGNVRWELSLSEGQSVHFIVLSEALSQCCLRNIIRSFRLEKIFHAVHTNLIVELSLAYDNFELSSVAVNEILDDEWRKIVWSLFFAASIGF
jgi:hypothetical protein